MEKHQIIHVDYMCNECGNCKSFCPYDSAPYLDKFTLFANEADMENSKNQALSSSTGLLFPAKCVILETFILGMPRTAGA